jgi:hypothetical protein
MSPWSFSPNHLCGYYIMPWHPAAEVRVEDSPSHKAMYEWCNTNCGGRFTNCFHYGHNRPEGEPYHDAWTWSFEDAADAEKFKDQFPHTWHRVRPPTESKHAGHPGFQGLFYGV